MKVNLSHGSGGSGSALLFDRIFAKHFESKILHQTEDAAVLDMSGTLAFSTDSFVIQPLFFPGGDIGKLSISGTVNDLLMMGAIPKYLSTAFILETGLEFETLEKIVVSMSTTARAAGVEIVTGDTKVVEGAGGLIINTSGIGLIPAERDLHFVHCKEGDAILLSGNLGDHEASILSSRMHINNQIRSDCAPLNPLVNSLFHAQIPVKAMRDVTRGGLGTILNEIASITKCGVECWEDALPIHHETQAFCNILGLDPIYMANEGKLLIVVGERDAKDALAVMNHTKQGENAAIIGRLRSESGVTLATHLGGWRTIKMLQGEALPRIC